MDKSSGEGTASDAVVVATMSEEEQTAADLEAGRVAGEEEMRASAARKVRAAEVAVDKAKATLAGAEDALAQAQAEQKGL